MRFTRYTPNPRMHLWLAVGGTWSESDGSGLTGFCLIAWKWALAVELR